MMWLLSTDVIYTMYNLYDVISMESYVQCAVGLVYMTSYLCIIYYDAMSTVVAMSTAVAMSNLYDVISTAVTMSNLYDDVISTGLLCPIYMMSYLLRLLYYVQFI